MTSRKEVENKSIQRVMPDISAVDSFARSYAVLTQETGKAMSSFLFLLFNSQGSSVENDYYDAF